MHDKEVNVRGHNKNSWGKEFSVKSYKRRVGRKGIVRWKKKPVSAKSTESSVTPPIPKAKTRSEAAAEWDRNARAIEKSRQAKMVGKNSTMTSDKLQQISEKHDDMFERAESKVAAFVEKYINKKYKRML